MKHSETNSYTGSSHTEKDEREVESIRQQLNARTEECVALKDQLRDQQRANADVLKWQDSIQENLCKVRRMIIMIAFSVAIIKDYGRLLSGHFALWSFRPHQKSVYSIIEVTSLHDIIKVYIMLTRLYLLN